jgi:hypothetical protein
VLERKRLYEILEEVGINNLMTDNKEIERLKCEISDQASERRMDARTPTR